MASKNMKLMNVKWVSFSAKREGRRGRMYYVVYVSGVSTGTVDAPKEYQVLEFDKRADAIKLITSFVEMQKYERVSPQKFFSQMEMYAGDAEFNVEPQEQEIVTESDLNSESVEHENEEISDKIQELHKLMEASIKKSQENKAMFNVTKALFEESKEKFEKAKTEFGNRKSR